MIKITSLALILLLAIFSCGCGKRDSEQTAPAQPQQTNAIKTNKLATFVQPKPKTNISVKITPAKKNDQTGSQPQTQAQSVIQSTTQQKPAEKTTTPQPVVSQNPLQPPADYASEQVESLKIRASNGDTFAQMELASRYLYGKGVEKDENEAIQWLSMAAQAGNAVAQNRLGLMYATGQAVQKDPTQAVYWYTLAAEQNHPTAQNNLGIMYATGNGVQKDEVEAYKWLTLAGSRITNAILYRDSIAKNMTPEQIETAKQRAQEFMSRFSQQNPTLK